MKSFTFFLPATVILLCTGLLIIASCKKEEVAERSLQETYINKTGRSIEITRYLLNLPVKKFSIAKDDTLIIHSTDNENADTTLTIRHADSALVMFDDGKYFMMRDTSKSARNFLNNKNFVSTISASGKIHYLRFTFIAADYELAQ